MELASLTILSIPSKKPNVSIEKNHQFQTPPQNLEMAPNNNNFNERCTAALPPESIALLNGENNEQSSTPLPSPTASQKIIQCSPVAVEGKKISQHTTKYLCAVIISLVFVIVALIVFDRPSSITMEGAHSPTSSSHRYAIATNRGPDRKAAADGGSNKLLASSSEDYPSRVLHSSPNDQLDDNHSLDDDDHSSNHNTRNGGGGGGGEEIDDDEDIASHTIGGNNNQIQGAGRPAMGSAAKQRDPKGICMSPGCIRASAQILNNMDNKTKPCDDFYQFACGRWIETQLIPDEKTSLSVFSQNTIDLNIKLRALIEKRPSKDDPPIVGQMRNIYASCMNLTDIEIRGDGPLLEVLEDLGGWPVVNDSKRNKRTVSTNSNVNGGALQQQSRRFVGRPARRTNRATTTTLVSNSDIVSANNLAISSSTDQATIITAASETSQKQLNWLDILVKYRERGFSHDMIIDLSVVPDVRNSRRYIIELDQSSLGLPDRSYYSKGLNDTTVAAYYNLMVESAVMLGASRDEAKRQMLEALEFETSLAKISVPREQRRNVTRLYNKMLAQDLYDLAKNIDWHRYLSLLLRDELLDLSKDEVVVKVPTFIRSLDTLLIETEPRIIANYMIWRIVRASMSGLSRRWRELAHSYSTITTGRLVEEPRWEQCLGALEGTLGTALSALYVKNHFNQQSKAAAMEMVEYISAEFLKILREIDWMDEETRKEAIEKAKGISPYIGYPDELLQDDLIEELYSGLELRRLNFYQNVRNLRTWSTNYAFGQLRKPNKRGDWKKHARAAVVNAYYNSLENSIEFPAGILQGAFFDAERPNYMNFGAIGYVIGHEITHGFDDRGRQFDKEGNDRNWWKPKTDARFKERAQCIIEQYGNYTVAENGLKVNGLNTQGENIADNGGIKEAFRAYKRWTKDNGRETRLPGLDYTPDQLFWISAANIWCGKFRPEVLKLRVNSGVHSPARFRIIGPLSNAPEFSKSFNCPVGSLMNPQKKCSVW